MPDSPAWRLEHSYSRLPDLFFTEVEPTPVAEPRLVIFNQTLAALLGLPEDDAAVYTGNQLPPGHAPSRRPMPGISTPTSPASAMAVRFGGAIPCF